MNCMGIITDPDADPHQIARTVMECCNQLADAASRHYRELFLGMLDDVPLQSRIDAACELSQLGFKVLHDVQPEGRSKLIIQLEIDKPERYFRECRERLKAAEAHAGE